jgi:hypothetical protein
VTAIGRELGVSDMAVWRWIAGTRQPENERGVRLMLRGLLKRRTVPKRPYKRSQ